jgi:hypothetical protein
MRNFVKAAAAAAALLLAGASNAATLITYTLTGTAWVDDFTKAKHEKRLQNITVTMSLLDDGNPNCHLAECGYDGSTLYARKGDYSSDWFGLFIGFDHNLSGVLPIDNAGFTGGDFYSVTNNSKLIVGDSVLNTLAVTSQTVSNATGANITLSFGTVIRVLPEPGTWAMMVAGFALVGASIRSRRGILSPNRLID